MKLNLWNSNKMVLVLNPKRERKECGFCFSFFETQVHARVGARMYTV